MTQVLQSKAAEIEKLLARLSDINDSMRRWGTKGGGGRGGRGTGGLRTYAAPASVRALLAG